MSASDLPRRIGFVDATVIVIGTVIGSAIFLVPNSVAQNLPSAKWILAVWTVSGVLSFFGALAFAELGAMIPATGGQYVYLREAYGPLTGFVSGWALFLVMQTGSLATLAAGFAIYLSYFIPLGTAGAKLASVLLIAALTIVNYRGVRLGVGVQRLFTFLKLAGLSIIVGSAFLVAGHSGVESSAAQTAAFSWNHFGVAMIACLWAYEGWNSLSFVAGEVTHPERNVPLALAVGLAALIAVYLTANVAYLRTMSVSEIASTSRVAARSAEISIGSIGATLVALTILVSIVGAANGTALTAARIYFAQARDGLFFETIGRVHPRFETPHIAIAAQGVWASVLAVSGSYERLFSYVVFAAWIFYGMAAVAVVVLRRRRPDLARPYRMWGYPVTPLLFAGVAFWFVVNTIVSEPLSSLIGLAIVPRVFPRTTSGIRPSRLPRLRAREARCVVYTPGSFVPGDLWIGTQRSRADHFAACDSRRNDRLGRVSRLHPSNKRRQHVEGAGSDAAAAMKHTWHHEQAVEVLRSGPQCLHDAFVVPDTHQRVQRRVGPSEVADDLAASGSES